MKLLVSCLLSHLSWVALLTQWKDRVLNDNITVYCKEPRWRHECVTSCETRKCFSCSFLGRRYQVSVPSRCLRRPQRQLRRRRREELLCLHRPGRISPVPNVWVSFMHLLLIQLPWVRFPEFSKFFRGKNITVAGLINGVVIGKWAVARKCWSNPSSSG